MPVFRLSAKSLEDLKSFGRFTLKSWGLEQRNIYLSKLDESFHILAEQPHLGNARDDIRKEKKPSENGCCEWKRQSRKAAEEAGCLLTAVRGVLSQQPLTRQTPNWLLSIQSGAAAAL